MQKKILVAKTLHGLEEVLASEIKEIGGEEINVLKRAVSFKGDLKLMYKANIWLRTALRILYPVNEFTFQDQEEFYRLLKLIPWDKFLSHDGTLAVDAVVNSKIFNHSKYVALRTKDAVVDFFKENYGIRPSVDTNRPTLRIHTHISENQCNLSLDSSGDPLFMRGYRSGRHNAPLNEVLAAGMVLLSGWDMRSPFIDPMCGSGTLGIEAALIAQNIPPSKLRDHFAFMEWKDFNKDMFNKLRKETRQAKGNPQIVCTDINPVFSRMTKAGAKRLGINTTIKSFTKDFAKLSANEGNGIIIINPPYGERMELSEQFELYTMIGSTLKHNWSGYQAWVLTNNLEAAKMIGLKPSGKITLFNGALECKFQKYNLYEGSKKQKKADL